MILCSSLLFNPNLQSFIESIEGRFIYDYILSRIYIFAIFDIYQYTVNLIKSETVKVNTFSYTVAEIYYIHGLHNVLQLQ